MATPPLACFLLPTDLRAGAGTRALGLVGALRQHGWLVEAVAEDPVAELARRVGDPAASLLASRIESERLISHWQRTKPDVIHVEVPGPEGRAWRLAARKLGLPLTATRHRLENWLPPDTLAEQRRAVVEANREFMAACRRVLIELSGERTELAVEGLHALDVVGNGVDPQLFNPAHRSTALRSTWGAQADTPVLLYVGRLLPAKGLDLLARALDAARARHPGVVAVIAGEGPGADVLRQCCPWAVFTGLLRGPALAAAYASADIFLFPSLVDNFGNVVIEALASGLACVAFDRAAAGAFLRDGRDGRVVADEAGFIAAAVELAGDPATVRRLGRAGLAVAGGLTWQAVGAAADTAFRRAIAEPAVVREAGSETLDLVVRAPLPASLPAGAAALLRRGHRLRWVDPAREPAEVPGLAVAVVDLGGGWSPALAALEARLTAQAAGLVAPATPLRIALVLTGDTAGDARTKRLAGGLRRLGHLPELVPVAAAAQRWAAEPPRVIQLAADAAPALAAPLAALAGKLGIPLCRASIPDGVDTVRYHPGQRSAELRTAWTVADDGVVVAVLVAASDAPTVAALQALATLRGCTVVGACIDGAAATALRAAGLRLPLIDGIPGEHLPRVLASAEMVLLPGPQPSGGAAMAVLASGALLISEDGGGCRGLPAGVRVTPTTIVGAVQELVDDGTRRAALAGAGRLYAERSSWTALAGQLVEHLAPLLHLQR